MTCRALVDSASPGRNEVDSFFSASANLPGRLPPMIATTTTSHPRATSHFARRPAGTAKSELIPGGSLRTQHPCNQGSPLRGRACRYDRPPDVAARPHRSPHRSRARARGRARCTGRLAAHDACDADDDDRRGGAAAHARRAARRLASAHEQVPQPHHAPRGRQRRHPRRAAVGDRRLDRAGRPRAHSGARRSARHLRWRAHDASGRDQHGDQHRGVRRRGTELGAAGRLDRPAGPRLGR